MPINAAKSIPLSPAIRRASGLAKIRVADGTAADDGVETGIVTAVPTGAGAEMRHAMGNAVFAGMIGVTVFGLLFTPVFYMLVVKKQQKAKGLSHD